MNAIQVVGIGLEGGAGLTESGRQKVEQASVLVGSDRHLAYFPQHQGRRIGLKDLAKAIAAMKEAYGAGERLTVLASGDPLFFGLGRLLLAEFPAEALEFYPNVTSVQLAFNRLKIPWHDAHLVSVHGRSNAELIRALRQGREKIAILTGGDNTPEAIALLLRQLDLPSTYEFWIAENLGGSNESLSCYALDDVATGTFAPLNVVILLRRETPPPLDQLPLFGLPDEVFLSFPDRPGLMTKREVRLAILGELSLQPQQTVWDLGAGTGSVAIEIARLCPDSRIYAIEKTAMGKSLIERNCDRLQVPNVTVIGATAPTSLPPAPVDRIFIGGSGGNLAEMLAACEPGLVGGGKIVLALATLEHLQTGLEWFKAKKWHYRSLQIQIARSVAIAELTRFEPLNPVFLITGTKPRAISVLAEDIPPSSAERKKP